VLCDNSIAAIGYAVMIRYAKSIKQIRDFNRPIQYPKEHFSNFVLQDWHSWFGCRNSLHDPDQHS